MCQLWVLRMTRSTISVRGQHEISEDGDYLLELCGMLQLPLWSSNVISVLPIEKRLRRTFFIK